MDNDNPVGPDWFKARLKTDPEGSEPLSYVNTWKNHKTGLFVFGENLVKGHGWGDLGGDQQITVTGVRNGIYRDAVTGNEIQVSHGNITFNVKGCSAGIYVLNGPGRIGENGDFLR